MYINKQTQKLHRLESQKEIHLTEKLHLTKDEKTNLTIEKKQPKKKAYQVNVNMLTPEYSQTYSVTNYTNDGGHIKE